MEKRKASHTAIVVPIVLEKHPNADALSVVNVDGQTVCVNTKQWEGIDKGCFIPCQNVVDCRRPEFSFLAKEEDDTFVVVKACKLRGVHSQGILVPVPDGAKIGDDLTNYFGVEHYEPEVTLAGDEDGNSHLLKNVSKYDIDSYAKFYQYFYPDEYVYVSEKIHGCFNYTNKLLLSDGSAIEIGKVVKDKLQVDVLCFNEKENKIESKRVTNWYNNGEENIWYDIRVQCLDKGNRPKKIICTGNHLFYIQDEGIKQISAMNLKVGDSTLQPQLKLNYIQKQMILGSLLGDASLYPNNNTSNKGFKVGHSVKQKDYLNLKKEILSNLIANEDVQTSGFGSEMHRINTRCIPEITELFNICYFNNEKRISSEWINTLDPIGLAFWYMDDGSISQNESQRDRANLATNGFLKEDVELISRLFNEKWCFNTSLIKSSSGWKIILDTESSERFFVLIAPYIHKSLQYKLPKEYQCNDWWNERIFKDSTLTLRTSKIVSINRFTPKSPRERIKYDIEVEDNHNFFINKTLVHNSNARFYYDGENFHVGSRSTWKKYNEDCVFWKAFHSHPSIMKFCMDNPKVMLYGEAYNNGQAAGGVKFIYDGGVPKNIKFRAFDVYQDSKYWDAVHFLEQMWKYDVPIVPFVGFPKFSLDLIKEMAEGQSLIGNHIREGVVVKPLVERQTPKFNRLVCKFVSNEYNSL